MACQAHQAHFSKVTCFHESWSKHLLPKRQWWRQKPDSFPFLYGEKKEKKKKNNSKNQQVSDWHLGGEKEA